MIAYVVMTSAATLASRKWRRAVANACREQQNIVVARRCVDSIRVLIYSPISKEENDSSAAVAYKEEIMRISEAAAS